MKSWVEVLIIIALAIGINFLCQGIFSLIKRSRLHPYLSRHSLGRKALMLIPGIFIYFALFYVYDRGSRTLILLHKLDLIYLIVVFIIIANAILMTFLDLYSQSDKNKSHPLKGLVQGLQVVLFFIGGILIIAILIDKSPTVLLTSLGASAAVLMLVFKDSILGFVAGVQLSQNNMIRIGDWIQLPDGSANGVVEEITLNTVKVRNWDNTITTIPPYTLVSSPFKNWRGMQESGGRRVDKKIFLDMDSVEFCSEDMVSDILKNVPLMRGWKGDGTEETPTNSQLYRIYRSVPVAAPSGSKETRPHSSTTGTL
jgi:small-conductance mechanosensitive channel